jgi:hypothetical protein
MGTETLFTQRRRAQIVKAIRAGRTLRMAAEAAGISPRTLDTWLARGRKSDAGPLFRQFVVDLDAARAEAEAEAASSEYADEPITVVVSMKWPTRGDVIPFPVAWDDENE